MTRLTTTPMAASCGLPYSSVASMVSHRNPYESGTRPQAFHDGVVLIATR
jgi:hypothetical protein